MRATALSVLLACSWLAAGCGASVRSDFDSLGWQYPFYVQRRVGPPQVADPQPSGDPESDFCRPAPQYAALLQTAVAGLDARALRALAQRSCPHAEAHAFVDPFIVEQPDSWGPFLALRVECHGRGATVDGVALADAAPRARSLDIERALNGWRVRGDADHYVKWNIALFRPGATSEFTDFLGRFDEAALSARLIEEYVDPLDALARCGRPPLRLGESAEHTNTIR